jgi:hypothetical protein
VVTRRLRSALGPADAFAAQRAAAVARAAPEWLHVLRATVGRTQRRLAGMEPHAAQALVAAMLRRRGHRTLRGHLAALYRYQDWVASRWPNNLPFPAHADQADANEAMLVDLVADLAANGCPAGAPCLMLRSLQFLQRLAAPDVRMALQAPAVALPALAYRRDAAAPRRAAPVYAVCDVQALERAAARHAQLAVRLVARAELLKLYAALRNDDLLWSPLAALRAGAQTVTGRATKTKATEATAVRAREGMPWAAPLAGVSRPAEAWWARHHEDMRAAGVPADAAYGIPSPRAVAHGLLPPGPAAPSECVGWLRRTAAAAGVPLDRARIFTLHSAKRTILTWAGISGAFTDRDLEVLGHHRSGGVGRTVRAYNAAELAAPVAKLRQLLAAIAAGDFRPDAVLSENWEADRASWLVQDEAASSARPARRQGARRAAHRP